MRQVGQPKVESWAWRIKEELDVMGLGLSMAKHRTDRNKNSVGYC